MGKSGSDRVARRRRLIRRIGMTILFGLVSGMATAAGAALVTTLFWLAGSR